MYTTRRHQRTGAARVPLAESLQTPIPVVNAQPYCFFPAESYLVTKKSHVPVSLFPSSPPVVCPATYTLPPPSTAMLLPEVTAPATPSCLVLSLVPAESYLARKKSCIPVSAFPSNPPRVSPATYTLPIASTATLLPMVEAPATPSCLVYCFMPAELYLVTNKSSVPPANFFPSSPPRVYPATYTLLFASTATLEALVSAPATPSCLV